MDQNLFDYVLGLGDDALVLAQRLTQWCGHAPTIEIDLSLSNLGLDLLGQATLFLGYAATIEGGKRDADKLAFHRDAHEFRNVMLVEQPNGDFGQTIVRQFLFSTWQKMLFDRLALSSDRSIADIATKAAKETAYHEEIAAEWVIRLGDGTDESHHRVSEGMRWMWRFVPELFLHDDTVQHVIACGAGVNCGSFRGEYDARVASVFKEAGIEVPPIQRPLIGGRRGHHSEHLGPLLSEMQYMPRAYPDARW